MKHYNTEWYREAADEFKALGDYKDSYEMWQKTAYMYAMDEFRVYSYSFAAGTFEELGNYKDSYEMWQKSMINYIIRRSYNSIDDFDYYYQIPKYLRTLEDLGYDCKELFPELYDSFPELYD